MISNSSISPSEIEGVDYKKTPKPNASQKRDPEPALPESGPPASVFLLPSFQYIPSIPTDTTSVEAFIKAFLLPKKLHHSYDKLSREQQNILLRQPELQSQFIGARKVDEILILICGHGGRDDRCGKLAPILIAEFEEKLQRQNIPVIKDVPAVEADEVNTEVTGYVPKARIASISHIGGHKFAGNVIVYIPPSFSSNPLAGKGIWYGRVGPENVEGIVAKTILEGKVIKDQFRGGIGQDGEILRL